MQIGVVFPQTELGADAGAVRAFAQAAQDLGFRHILAYDHVVGADPAVHTGWAGPYDVHSTFVEIMVLMGFLAGVCDLEMATGVVILPQRQTVLAAKQASAVDVITGGRLRLGIGIGWNPVEYVALSEDFHNRGRRIEEQVELMRLLWTQESVTFQGEWHRVTGAGLAPLPVQRPIPVWFGGGANERVLRRIGRLGDGWMPQLRPGEELDRALTVIRDAARDAGRDPDALGIEGRIQIDAGDLDRLARQSDRWAAAGASHLSVGTMGAGRRGADSHIEALRLASAALGLT